MYYTKKTKYHTLCWNRWTQEQLEVGLEKAWQATTLSMFRNQKAVPGPSRTTGNGTKAGAAIRTYETGGELRRNPLPTIVTNARGIEEKTPSKI